MEALHRLVCRSAMAGAAMALAAAGAAQPSAAPPLSPRNASYSIDARLDPTTNTITASETITWRNVTSRAVDDLQFHLYWNAWRDDRSTWMREGQRSARRPEAARRTSDWARIDVTALRVGADDLTGRMHFIAPDDDNADDKTVVSVPLPRPAAPGATLTIAVTWTAQVPRTFARTGAIGHFFFIAQWFPKLGVLQAAGWNCHQFHANTEFFSDYGTYDVRLTVPDGWLVGASGVGRDVRRNGDGTSTHRYAQDDVHDFAWTTSPDYLERRARFEHPTLPPVELRLLLQPEHASHEQRYFDATRAVLKYYGEWYGPYPYPQLTIVDPAFQSGADGMEYPTLFTGDSVWLDPPAERSLEATIIHEGGHQFWYGIVGNNEFEDAWLDEGINTYSDARVQAEYGPPPHYSARYFGGFVPYVFHDIVLDRYQVWNMRASYRAAAKSDAPSTPSFRHDPSVRSAVDYFKPALWLDTMERWLGWPVQQRILATFFERWKFKHPTAGDFFRTASEVAGRDLGGFFDEVYRSSNVFDYGVAELGSVRAAGTYRTTVVVRRYGEAVFPVDVLVTFDDGGRVTERWDGRERWRMYTYERAGSAATAEVDPNHVLALDVNLTNNSRTMTPRGPEAASKWSLKWMVWLEDCLLSWSFLV